MPAGPWLNNAIWITLAGCVYFRATLTAERNLKILLSRSATDVSDETMAYITKLGPVSFRDPRILISSLIVSACAWLGPFCNDGAKWALLMLSLGAFFSPLTLPSVDIEFDDIKHPVRLLVKWVFSKFDKYFKQLLLGGIIFLLLKLPWLGRLLKWYATSSFPLVEGSGSRLFEEVLGAGALVLILMICLRLTQMITSGKLFCAIWLCSVAFLWMSLQYEADEILKVKPLAIATVVLFLTTTGIDFLNDLLEAVIREVDASRHADEMS